MATFRRGAWAAVAGAGALTVALVGCGRDAVPPGNADTAVDPGAHAVVANLAVVAPVRPPSPLTVCVLPLGGHDPTLLAPIARGIAQAYGFPVRTLAPRPLPESAWYPPRQRYRAERLLAYLRDDVIAGEGGCDALIGFTSVDVSTTKGEYPDWGVLGLGFLDGDVAVVSSFRMRRDVDARRIAERAVKVINHELGHVVGLAHRGEGEHCLMNDAGGSVQAIDRARGVLCPGERAELEAKLGRELPRREELDWDEILGGRR